MNIYLGNLNYKVVEDDLRGLLEEFGPVASARVIVDRDTRRSRGFGFVEMENEDDARNAIAQLQDQEFMGRKLVVKEAEESRKHREPTY